MIVYNAGEYGGEGTLGKLTTYRDGGLSLQVLANNDDGAAVLLKNVNKLCQLTVSIDGKGIQATGELAKLSTLAKGGRVSLDFVLSNEPKIGAYFLANVKKAGAMKVEFSSVAGNGSHSEEDAEDEEEGQQALDFMTQASEDGKPTEGVDATDKPEDLEDE